MSQKKSRRKTKSTQNSQSKPINVIYEYYKDYCINHLEDNGKSPIDIE